MRSHDLLKKGCEIWTPAIPWVKLVFWNLARSDRSIKDVINHGLELGQVEEKKKGKTRCDSAIRRVDPTRPGYKLVDFYFFCFFLPK